MELKNGHSINNSRKVLVDLKKNVLFLFGGESSEYEISCISAYNVLNAVDTERYNVIPLGITRDGEWYYYDGDFEKIKDLSWNKETLSKAIISPCKSDKGIIIFDKTIRKIKIDLCFPVLHGKNGEDGTVQGLLTLAGIPFVGCSFMSSSLCMDKVMTKIVLEKNNIPQTPYIYIKDTDNNIDRIKEEIIKNIGYPCFVKPVNAGSSMGACKVNLAEELDGALSEAFLHDKKVLVEKFVNCREIEVAVMGNDELKVAGPGEILSDSEFYDYDTKYHTDSVGYQIPANLTEEVAEKIREYAKKAYRVLDCKGLSRVDFFISRDNEEIYLNEINTLPGFTNISMYPKLFISEGLSYKELVTELIEIASL